MRHKSDVGDVFMAFAHRFSSLGSTPAGLMTFPQDHTDIYKGVGACIKRRHSDNAKEYVRLGKDLGGGVDKSFAPAYTPELNAIAERVNRTIEDASRSMLIQANLPTCLWPFAVKHVVYVRNRVAHSTTNQTPYSLVTGEKPNLKNVRVFGCAAFVFKQPEGRKFDPRAIEGVLLEIMDHGVYKVLVKEEHDLYSIVESKHVTFDESRFPGAPDLEECMDEEVDDDSTWCDTTSSVDEVDFDEDLSDDEDVPVLDDDSDNDDDDAYEDDQVEDGMDNEGSDAEGSGSNPDDNNEEGAHDADNVQHDDSDDDFQGEYTTPNVPPTSYTHRYPRRNRKAPSNWFMAASSPTITVTTGDDPTLKEAMDASPEERETWLSAIDEEFQSIADNETWEPDDAPKATPLPTHVVLNVKRKADGEVDRFKERIVAGGKPSDIWFELLGDVCTGSRVLFSPHVLVPRALFGVVCCSGGHKKRIPER